MSDNVKKFWTETLPDPLPANPLEVAADWLAQARTDAAQPNPNAMVLATADDRGFPSARVVLCKEIAAQPGFIVFYTNYQSRKGRELAANPRAAVVFHWDHRHRQVRIEGRVEVLSDADNDRYFQSRAWQSRLGAWASPQSRPLEDRAELDRRLAAVRERFADTEDVPRPDFWGGFVLRPETIEFWQGQQARLHDRFVYSWDGAGDWRIRRLAP